MQKLQVEYSTRNGHCQWQLRRGFYYLFGTVRVTVPWVLANTGKPETIEVFFQLR